VFIIPYGAPEGYEWVVALVVLVALYFAVRNFMRAHPPSPRKYLKKARPLAWLRRDRQGGAADAQSEREFRTVFSMTSQAGKEAIIERWMRRQGCSRSEAMRLAVEEWRRDNR
jgi:hypothetical protein